MHPTLTAAVNDKDENVTTTATNERRKEPFLLDRLGGPGTSVTSMCETMYICVYDRRKSRLLDGPAVGMICTSLTHSIHSFIDSFIHSTGHAYLAALMATLDIFYDRLVNDERMAPFFQGISITRLKVHQKKFLTMAFTEIPTDMDVAAYMVDKHARLFQEQGLNGQHFDVVAGHLVASLQQLDVPKHLIDEVVEIVGPLRVIFSEEADRILHERK